MRRRGHKTSPVRERMRFGAAHPSSLPAIRPAASLRAFKPQTFDQGETSTCFAHVPATLIYVAFAARGARLVDPPSPCAIARSVYAFEQPGVAPLEDTGATLTDVATALERIGVKPLGALATDGRYSDVDPDRIRVRPTLAHDLACGRELVLGLEHISAAVDDFEEQVAASIDVFKCGVSLGIHDSPAFSNWKPGDPAVDDASGFTDDDGHDVGCLEYRTSAAGELEFWLLSSWSDAFGEAGGAWVTGSWLRRSLLEAWRFRASFRDGRTPPA